MLKTLITDNSSGIQFFSLIYVIVPKILGLFFNFEKIKRSF